jgi:hypothetical protein
MLLSQRQQGQPFFQFSINTGDACIANCLR